MIWQGNDSPRGHSTSARANREGQKPVSTQASPAELVDGLSATVEKDGRLKFALTRKRKAFAHLTLPANQAGEIAANALGGAYDAHDQALMGLVPPAERKTSYPFVRITGLGLGPCTIEDHAPSSASPSPRTSSSSSPNGSPPPKA
jgi:hypothetical protein